MYQHGTIFSLNNRMFICMVWTWEIHILIWEIRNTILRAWKGGLKEHRAKQNSFNYIGTRNLKYYTLWHSVFKIIPLLPEATFTPSIQFNLGLPCTCPPLSSTVNTFLAICYSSILGSCPNHLNTLWSATLANSLLFQLSFAPLHS